MHAVSDAGPFDVFLGLDVGKGKHHGCALAADGRVLWDRELPNEEAALDGLLRDLVRSGRLVLVVDQAAAIGALAIEVAHARGVPVGYLPGLAMRRLADIHPGHAKTDPRDAYVIADAARTLPHTLRRIDPADPQQAAGLGVLCGYDEDLRAQVNRETNRLRDAITHIHPPLERALAGHFDRSGVPALLAKAPTPEALRRMGRARMTAIMAKAGSPRLAKTLPDQIKAALAEQTLVLPGTDAFGAVIAGTAARLAALLAERDQLEQQLQALLAAHPLAGVLTSMPGVGVRTAAGILAIVGDIGAFPDAAHLASYAGLAPTTKRSGTSIRGETMSRRGHRQLKTIMYRSADIARVSHPASRTYYNRKRAEGKRHTAAVLCLARRRCDVIYALLRDQQPYREPAAAA